MTISDQLERLTRAAQALEGAGARILEARASEFAKPCIHTASAPPAEFVVGTVERTALVAMVGQWFNSESTLGVALTWYEVPSAQGAAFAVGIMPLDAKQWRASV